MHALTAAAPASQTAKTVLLLPQNPGAGVSEQAQQHGMPSSMLQQDKAVPATSLGSDVVAMLDKLHLLQEEGLRFASRM